MQSDDPEPQTSTKKCHICFKSFGFRKKHICKFCNNAVCSDHCQRERIKNPDEGPLPICDLCTQDFIKQQLESELDQDIASLEEELAQSKSTNSRLEREHFEKTAAVSKLENDLDSLCLEFELKIKRIQEHLVGEELEANEMVNICEKAKAGLEKAKDNDREANERIIKTQGELESLKKQAEILKETKDGLVLQLDRVNSKLKGSLSLEQVSKILCENCGQKLAMATSRREEAPSILEDPTISLGINDERQSILESVREFTEILSKQNTNTEDGKCEVW